MAGAFRRCRLTRHRRVTATLHDLRFGSRQWLDADSADALRFALDRLADESVGAIVTTSEDEVAVVDGRHAALVQLSPLPVDELRLVLAGSLPAVTRPELVRAHELSVGNPTAARQFVRSWAAERLGVPATTDVVFAFHGLPGAIHQLVNGRQNPDRFHVAGSSRRAPPRLRSTWPYATRLPATTLSPTP
jgi:hypothetical protein